MNLRTQVRTYISNIKEPFLSYRAEVLAISFVCDRTPDESRYIPEEAAWSFAGRAYYNRVLRIIYELSTEYADDELYDDEDEPEDSLSSIDNIDCDDTDILEDS